MNQARNNELDEDLQNCDGDKVGGGPNMDTLPLSSQEFITGESVEMDRTDQTWGTLYTMKQEFYNLHMIKDIYTFGRNTDCDYCFDIPSVRKTKYFNLYSKRHFSISRSLNPDGSTLQFFVEDLGGRNGIYINGEKLPLKANRPLLHGDKIALSSHLNDVFLFIPGAFSNSQENDEFSEKYIMCKKIGSGACGDVSEIWLKHGFGRFACKTISKVDLSNVKQDIMTEARILKELDHPGVIGIYDVIERPDKLYIVLEYALGGDLFNRISSKGALPEDLAKLYFFQMLNAVMYLHNNKITHRDLKPENVLLMSNDEPCVIKITDFGLSRFVSEETLMHTFAGSPSYLPPEILRQVLSKSSEGYTKLVDMWSLGVILFVCLVAYHPFKNTRHDTSQGLKDQILSANYNFKPPSWKKVSSLAKDLIVNLLKVNITERFNSCQALNHAWFEDPIMQEKSAKLFNTKSSSPLMQLDDNSEKSESVDTRKVSTDVDSGSKDSGDCAEFEPEEPPSKQIKLN